MKHRTDRNTHCLSELAKLSELNLVIARWEASPKENEIVSANVTRNHMDIIKFAKEKNLSRVLICEDDIQIVDASALLSKLQRILQSPILWDVLMLGTWVLNYQKVKDYIDIIKINNSWCGHAYIVHQRYYDTIIDMYSIIYKNQIINYKDKLNYDNLWSKYQLRDEWFGIYPTLVSQIDNYSDVYSKDRNLYSKILRLPIKCKNCDYYTTGLKNYCCKSCKLNEGHKGCHKTIMNLEEYIPKLVSY